MDWVSVLAIIGSIGTLIGILLTIILYKRGVKKKDPIWAYDTDKIIGIGSDTPKEISLLFNNKQIQNVFRTRLLFYNKGKEIIDKLDIISPLKIEFSNSEILVEPNIIAKSREEINLDAKRCDNNSSIQLGFEYLDYQDGVMIEIIHTEYKELKIHHNIKGAKTIKNLGEIEEQFERSNRRTNYIGLAASFLFYLLGILTYFWTKSVIIAVISAFALLIITAIITVVTDQTSDFPNWSKIRRKNTSFLKRIFSF